MKYVVLKVPAVLIELLWNIFFINNKPAKKKHSEM